MKFFYNTVYLLLLTVGLPWLIWRVAIQGKNRTGWKEKLFGLVPNLEASTTRCRIWIHAVSVGEVNLLPKLVAEIKSRYPACSIAISTTTETGLRLARDKFPNDQVFFCPSDFSWAIGNALDRIKPDMLVLTELEIWPNLISLTSDRDIPILLINGRIGEGSYRGYRQFGFLMGPILNRLTAACVQTTEYRDRLMRLGVNREKIVVTGNVKFDNAGSLATADPPDSIASQIANFDAKHFVFVGGSTLEVEDLMLISIFAELKLQHDEFRLVLVPRHPNRVPRIEDELRRRELSYGLRSKLNPVSHRAPSQKVLIVDVIGELADWWRQADAGFVGGSMGRRGGQNMIEPSALAVPICFGPDTRNFKDVAQLLLDADAAQRIADHSELKQFIQWTISSPTAATEMGQRAQQTVFESTRGACSNVALDRRGDE